MTASTLFSDAVDLRAAMARHAAGVTVVTTRDAVGAPVGFTATAFSSLSLDPPLILVCLDRQADCFPAFLAAEHFGVSVLAAGQAQHARRFAARGGDKFADLAIELGAVTGLPLLPAAAARLECRTVQRLDGGDHIILLGHVLHAESTDREPLLHFNRQFGRFAAHD